MSGKTNTTVIGVFVLGALLLGLGAIMALGSGLFFTQKYRCIMFFPNSVSGLEVGAPVLFRGVPIGAVREISLEADATQQKFYIPVVVEIFGNKISLTTGKADGKSTQTLGESRKDQPDPGELLPKLIDRGLRAQLVTQSFVTGQLAVSLDLMPGTQVRLVGDTSLPEIPTVPSTFEKLTETIKRLPLEELVSHLTSAAMGIEKLVNSPQISCLPGRIDTVLGDGTDLLKEIKDKIGPLSQTLGEAVANFAVLASHLDQRTEGLVTSTSKALASLDATLKDSRGAIQNIQRITNANSPTIADLNRVLSEVASAARSLRELSAYLERHPEALIQGKGGPHK